MKKEIIHGIEYRLPDTLSKFQKHLYVHLINYKWNKLNIKEPGLYRYKGADIFYDAILPLKDRGRLPLLYPKILNQLNELQKKLPFKLHTHFNHMASSQAANANLFIPLLIHSRVNEVLRPLKDDFKCLAKDELYNGYQVEFWDGKGNDVGLLGDHNARSGTDADIAIAYYNQSDELCLWLIEHKLTESEFTECGGFTSKNRNKVEQCCESSFSAIIDDKSLCYYHKVRSSNYWKITSEHLDFFKDPSSNICPFKGGMNQLWRNQLMGLALESQGKFKHVYFSVVKHPENNALDKSIAEYKSLIDNNQKFSVFNSNTFIQAAKSLNDNTLNEWADWYSALYDIK